MSTTFIFPQKISPLSPTSPSTIEVFIIHRIYLLILGISNQVTQIHISTIGVLNFPVFQATHPDKRLFGPQNYLKLSPANQSNRPSQHPKMTQQTHWSIMPHQLICTFITDRPIDQNTRPFKRHNELVGCSGLTHAHLLPAAGAIHKKASAGRAF